MKFVNSMHCHTFLPFTSDIDWKKGLFKRSSCRRKYFIHKNYLLFISQTQNLMTASCMRLQYLYPGEDVPSMYESNRISGVENSIILLANILIMAHNKSQITCLMVLSSNKFYEVNGCVRASLNVIVDVGIYLFSPELFPFKHATHF